MSLITSRRVAGPIVEPYVAMFFQNQREAMDDMIVNDNDMIYNMKRECFCFLKDKREC